MSHTELTCAAPGNGSAMRGHVLLRPGQIELCDLPLPTPDPDGVVVRIQAALTCGTDLKMFLRGHPKFPIPTPFGHEFAGQLAAVGSHVRGFREGDSIMAAPTAPCGACYHCARQEENLCGQVMDTMVLGAYAEYIKLPASIVNTNLYHKPGFLSYAEAALLEPLACVLHGLSHVRVLPDDTVVLLGAGAIALLHAMVLRGRGVPRVVVVARSERRAEHVRALGAIALVVDDAQAALEPILELTDGRGADLVVECTGQVDVWEVAPGLARRGGQVVLFGGCPSGTFARFDAGRLHYDQVRVVSPFHFTPRDVRAAHEMLSTGEFGGHALVAAEYPLEGLAEALRRHLRGDGAKFAIIPNAT